ncbi:hypothetical protein PV379_06600, partial [Streptomyces caniscabiei]|uniref:hypothetical protein n=1 Tax=Streptomyces caniscabiei TaxID=2746961 RepID=UPI0029B9351A
MTGAGTGGGATTRQQHKDVLAQPVSPAGWPGSLRPTDRSTAGVTDDGAITATGRACSPSPSLP